MSALAFGPMRRLEPGDVRFVVVHTSGSPGNADSSAASIHEYHRARPPRGRGWSGIGYHAVVRKDGSIEEGRPLEYHGAHAEGLNHCSLGICCSGNGDVADFTEAQKNALARRISEWMQAYDVPLGNILGHRELSQLPDVPRTSKSCPGNHVSMLKVRSRILLDLIQTRPEPKVISYPDRLKVPPPSALDLEFR